jgi:hypothetical protein
VEAKHKAQQLEDERLRQETVKDGSVIADFASRCENVSQLTKPM